jgi:PCFT/HCP family folate transporter-like MFS transporter 1/3
MIGNASTLIWTLAVLHFWKSIPVRAIFISPAFQIVGGGYNVISAVIFSMAADVESTENR